MTKHRCNFYLRWPEKPESPVYAYATFGGERLRFSVGLSIPTEFWDSEAQKVRSTQKRKSYPQASTANAYLEQVRGEIGKVLSALVLQGVRPTPQLLAKHLESFRLPTKRKQAHPDKSPFFGAYTEYLEERKKHVGEGRLAVFRTLEKHLQGFETSSRVALSFESLTPELYEQFLDYLYANKLIPSTVRKNVKALRCFLKHANERGTATTPYTRFKLPKDTTPEIIALTEAELQAMTEVDLSTNQRLAHARDLFLIQCYTGLRFSDVISLGPDNIDLTGRSIRLRVKKTEEPLRIPITEPLRRLLLAYELDPPKITNQEMNRSLKNVALIAGLTESVRLVIFEGRKRKEEVVPKWRAVTSHTGRKTFCTISLLRGALPETVMRVSGHADYKTFKRYIEITDSKTAEEMQRIWGGA
jgi:integrase